MDIGQETTEVSDTNSSKASASSLSQLGLSQQIGTDNKVSQARERNDRNRDHLSTAFRVYKQLYGEEAAKEAFIEIASTIANDDDLLASNKQRNTTEIGTPKYMAYRQSLSSPKETFFSSTNTMPPKGEIQNDMKVDPVIIVSPATSNSVNSNEVINYSHMQGKPAISEPQTQLVEDEVSQAVLSMAASSEAISGSVIENLPELTTPEPPRYIKYRTGLSKSGTSSMQSESVNTSHMSAAEVSDDENKSVPPTESLLGDFLHADTDASDIGTSEVASKMPRYVKYRTSLSRYVGGSVGSASPSVQPNISSMSDDEPGNNFTRNEDKEIIAAAQNLLSDMKQAEQVQRKRGLSDSYAENESPTSPGIPSSHRYMAYRSSLKEKPWTSPPTDALLLSTTPSGGIAVYESFDSTSGMDDAQRQTSGVDSTEGGSKRQRTNLIPPSSPRRLEADKSFDVSEGATAQSILSDLHEVEKDSRTLVSESSEASTPKVSSVAEQMLISSTASDDGMGLSLADQSTANSFADHSAATPIISNSTHKKDRKSRSSQPGISFLSYESNSSFDSDIQEEPMAFLTSMSTSPNIERKVESKQQETDSPAIPLLNAIPPVRDPDQSDIADRELDDPLDGQVDILDSFESDESSDIFNSSLNLTSALTSGPVSKSLIARDSASSESDSSSSVSSSTSSDTESTGSSGGKPLVDTEESKLDKSVDKGIILPTTDTTENAKSSNIEGNDVVKITSWEPEISVDTQGSDEADTILNNRTAPPSGSETDIEAGNVSCMATPKVHENKKIERRKRFLFATLLFLLLILILGLGLGIGLSKRRERNEQAAQPSPTAIPPHPVVGTVPTRAPTPSSPNTYAPTVTGGALRALLTGISSDGGTALNTFGTPQNIAFEWLLDDPKLQTYDDMRRVQRYSLATFYHSTNGKNWTESSGWATYTDECEWFSRSSRILSCDSDGRYRNLDLGFNEVSGTIPPEIGMLTMLSRVIVSGGIRTTMTGSLPTELGLLGLMQTFLIQGNSIFGTIPQTLLRWSGLETIDMSLNNLSGSIPNEVGSWQALRFLDFSGNRFVGTIPPTIEQLVSLERMSLGDNQITGVIPTNIDRLTSLKVLNIEKNQIAGIPSQLGNIRTLETLTASENKISGKLITEIGGLIALRRLSLSRNAMTGTIPAEIGSMASLRYLDLSVNQFTGSIPSQIGQLSDILSLQLETNRLVGPVPVELSSLSGASLIRIDGNDLTGEVPQAVCDAYSVGFPTFYVDCAGQPPQVACRDLCCTFCCNDGGTCECAFIGSPYEFLCR